MKMTELVPRKVRPFSLEIAFYTATYVARHMCNEPFRLCLDDNTCCVHQIYITNDISGVLRW